MTPPAKPTEPPLGREDGSTGPKMGARRVLLAALLTAYLGIGSWFGYALHTAMPAVNLFGATYVALTWPAWLRGSPVKLPISAWAFSFPDPSDGALGRQGKETLDGR